MVRVVLADDHPIWRSGVRADLGSNFHVVGEAGDADEAIEVIRATKPDLVVCDLHMPNGGGIKVAKTCGEETRIVMLTVSEAERDLLDAVAAGAVGYLVKSTPPEELRRGCGGRRTATGVLAVARVARARRVPAAGQGQRPRPTALRP